MQMSGAVLSCCIVLRVAPTSERLGMDVEYFTDSSIFEHTAIWCIDTGLDTNYH